MAQPATVSAYLIYTLLQHAAGLGIDPSEACRSAGLDPDPVRHAKGRYPAELYYRLWRETARLSGDPDFGLHFAEQAPIQTGGDVLTTVMLNCASLGEALERLRRYHGLATDLIQVRLWRQGGLAGCGWQSALPDVELDRQIGEAVTCRLFLTIRALSNGQARSSEVCFRHPRPNEIAEHRRIFACRLRFDQPRAEVVFGGEALDLALPLADARLLEGLEALAHSRLAELDASSSWSERAARAIGRRLRRGEKPSLSIAASELAVSRRQLQKMLQIEGTSYQALLDAQRQELALAWLRRSEMTITDIAFLLGYSDQSAFNHAFKRWMGRTPKEFRGG